MAKKKDKYYPILIEVKTNKNLIYGFVVLEKEWHLSPLEAVQIVKEYIKNHLNTEVSQITEITSASICAVLEEDKIICGHNDNMRRYLLMGF